MGYPSPGVLTSSIDAGVPVDLDLGAVPGSGLRLRAAREEQDHEPEAARGQDDRRSARSAGSRSSTRCWPRSASTRRASSTASSAPQWVQAVALGQADAGARLGGPARAADRAVGDVRLGVRAQVPRRLDSGARRARRTRMSVRQVGYRRRRRRGTSTRGSSPVGHRAPSSRRRIRVRRPRSPTARPALQQLISPQVALESMMQLASGYSRPPRRRRTSTAGTTPRRGPGT